MPFVSVPDKDERTATCSSSSDGSFPGTVRIEYNVRGTGEIFLLFVPGLCVPSMMFDDIIHNLMSESSDRYTLVCVENRGMKGSQSGTSRGWTVDRFARDGWAVIDTVIRGRYSTMPNGTTNTNPNPNNARPFPRVGLIGHSMGGMIVQRMAVQRPRDVGLLIPISTHAGGFWNLIPTGELFLGFMKLVMKGHNNPRQKARFTIGLHFTQRFVRDAHDELMTRYLNGATEDYAQNNNNNNNNAHADNNNDDANTPLSPSPTAEAEMRIEEGGADVALRGHVNVVRSHSLARHEAAMIGNCERIYKMVLAGRSDCVIVPSASRKLGKAIKADVIVEVDGAHFIVEEAHTTVFANLKQALEKCFGSAASSSASTSKSTGLGNNLGSIHRKCDCSVCAPRGRKMRISMDIFRGC